MESPSNASENNDEEPEYSSIYQNRGGQARGNQDEIEPCLCSCEPLDWENVELNIQYTSDESKVETCVVQQILGSLNICHDGKQFVALQSNSELPINDQMRKSEHHDSQLKDNSKQIQQSNVQSEHTNHAWEVDIFYDGDDIVVLDRSILDGCNENLQYQELASGVAASREESKAFAIASSDPNHAEELEQQFFCASDYGTEVLVNTHPNSSLFNFDQQQAEEFIMDEGNTVSLQNELSHVNCASVGREIFGGEKSSENLDDKRKDEDSTNELADWIEPEDDTDEMEKNCRLTHVFRDMLKRCIKFQYSDEENKDIIESVQELVDLIISKVKSNVDWLPVSRLVRVGSIEEETSVVKPDEFDYIVVLEHKGIEITRVCEKRKGYAHVKVKDPKLNTLWRKWFRGGYLKGAFTTGFLDQVKHVIGMIPNGLRKIKDKYVLSILDYFNTLGDAFLFEVEEVIRNAPKDELTIECDNGKLFPTHDVRKHGPCFMPTFIWESKNRTEKIEIGVDITPALEIDIPDGFISESETFHSNIWYKLRKHGNMMLIPDHESEVCSSGLCFRLTFTETEIEMVKDMTAHHKDVYKLLKYVFNSGKGYKYLPSYVFKTLILKHDCYCRENANLAQCFKQIVAASLHYMFNRKTGEKVELSRIMRFAMRGEKFQMSIPSLFIKKQNILDNKDFPFTCELLLEQIECMLESLDEVSRMDDSDVDFRKVKIVSRIKTGVGAYLTSFRNKRLLFKRCSECLGKYCWDNIL